MKTVKVKFIKYHDAFAHDVDDEAELLESDAKKLLDSGHVVPVKAGKETATGNKGTETATV